MSCYSCPYCVRNAYQAYCIRDFGLVPLILIPTCPMEGA